MKNIFVMLSIVLLLAACGGGSTPSPAGTTENGTASQPYTEAKLLAANNLNPNGYVKSSSSGTLFNMNLGTFSAALLLPNNDEVTYNIKNKNSAAYTFTRLDGTVLNYTEPDVVSFDFSTGYSTAAFQGSWITDAILGAWSQGLNGNSVNIAILDDFTLDSYSEIEVRKLANTCFNLAAGGNTVWYCTDNQGFLYRLTHGDQVSLILSGNASIIDMLFYSNGRYANPLTPTTLAGVVSMTQPVTVGYSSPTYGVAYGARSTTKRADYITHQNNSNGLFNKLQFWGNGTDTTSVNYRKTQVVNLSLGGTSKNPVYNSSRFLTQLAYANESSVPDAVFVKAAGNFGCIISQTNCDPNNGGRIQV